MALIFPFVPSDADAQDTPSVIIDLATRATETDSVQQLRLQWRARVVRDSSDLAARFGLATLARLTYDYERADSLYGALLGVEGEQGERFDVWARLGQGINLQSQGAYVQAQIAYAEAAAQAADRDSMAHARALTRLAAMRARSEGPAAALDVLREVEALISAEDLKSRAAYHCQRAVLVRSSDDPWAGLDEGRRGADLAERAGDRRTRASCLHALAQIHLRNGHTDGALDLLSQAEALQQSVRDRAGRAATLQWAGYVHQTLESYGQARRLLHESILEAEASGNLSPAAWAYLSLSGIALRTGDRSRAAGFGERAMDIFRVRQDPQGELMAQLALADVRRAAGQPEKARAIYLELLPDLERVGAYDWHMLYALTGLMDAAMSERNWDDAMGWLNRADEYARARGMTGWASGLAGQYAEVALAQGDLTAAERYIASALATPAEGVIRYRHRVQRAELRLRRGDLQGAEAELVKAADALDDWRATLDLQGLRRHAFQLTGWDYDPDLRLATILSELATNGHGDAAFRAAERRRARSLLDQLVRADALRGGDAGSDIESLRGRSIDVEAADIASALPGESVALLEYVTGMNDEPTTLFAVTRKGLRTYRLPAIDSLAPGVERFRTAIMSGLKRDHLARQLAVDLLLPAIDDLAPTVNHLLVIADGALHELPFDLLRLPSGEMLVERFLVTLAPSAAVIRQLWADQRPKRSVRILVFADPRFDRVSDESLGGVAAELRSAFAEEGGLTPLPGSRKEARRIARYAEGSEVRLGADASEAFVKEASLDEFRVLHFATHALVDSRTISRTALALAPGGGEDGFLEPGEIAGLSLGADLVVLSACRTAAGVFIRGEGVYGLTAPLLETGARSVLATSWSVGDRAAAEFVESFYDGLATGHSVGASLHLAKLDAIRRGVLDREWAAYALVGDPFVRVSLRRPYDTRWMAVLIVSVLVSAAGAAWLVRRLARTLQRQQRVSND